MSTDPRGNSVEGRGDGVNRPLGERCQPTLGVTVSADLRENSMEGKGEFLGTHENMAFVKTSVSPPRNWHL